MPPKKPATSTIVGQYDIELMTEQELRMYILALQEEHSRMRKARSLYSKDKNELLGFLKSIQEKILDLEQIDIQKNLKIQQLMIDYEQILKSEDASNKILELEDVNKAEKDILEAFVTVKTAEIVNREGEEVSLMNDIAERDREIQHMEYISKLVLGDLRQNHFQKYHQLSSNCKDNFENIVKEYNENFLKVVEDFSKNKIETLQAILGAIPTTDENSLANFIAEMSEYFKDIYWKNIKTIEELQLTLTSLKKELKTLTLNLRDVVEENNTLRSFTHTPSSPNNGLSKDPTFSSTKCKQLEDVTYENYLLTLKLEMLSKEYSNLKEKFVSALRKIYQKADFKAFLLEQKLSALQNPPEKYSYPN